MNRRAFDLIAVSAFAAIAMTLALRAPVGGAGRALVTLPLALFLPGYAITAAVFPGREPGAAERLLFSLGLSLATAVCGGLLLHWSSLGLRAEAWAALLANITLVASLVALARRWRRPGDAAPGLRAGLTLLQGAQLGLAALLVGGALLLARDGAAAQRGAGFTQLWALPGETASVRLGVSNHEAATMRYRLQVTAGGHTIQSWPLIALGAGEQWQATLELPTQPGNAAFEATLYQVDAPEAAYRRVVFRSGQ